MISFGFDISGVYNLNDNLAFVYALTHDNEKCIEIVDSDIETVDQNDVIESTINEISSDSSIFIVDNEPLTVENYGGNHPNDMGEIIIQTTTVPSFNIGEPIDLVETHENETPSHQSDPNPLRRKRTFAEIASARTKREQTLFGHLKNPFNSDPIEIFESPSKIQTPSKTHTVDDHRSPVGKIIKGKIKCNLKSRGHMLSIDMMSTSKLNV